MNYNELVKTIKHRQRMNDSDIQRLTEICNNYKQAMTAFELSCKFCNDASYELLSMALGYASPDSINEVVSQADNLTDPDSKDAIVADAIEFYDSAVLSSIHSILYGYKISDYGLGNMKRVYEQAPEKSDSKGLAADKIVDICNLMFGFPHDCTEARLKKITSIITSDQKILSIKAKAEKMLASGDFR